MSGDFYVYAYFRLDGTPCYIGKGFGERWRHRGSYGRNRHFKYILAQAKAVGQKLPCEKLVEGLSDREALDLEAFFIAAIGREVDGGPLVNLSVGGDRGPVGYRHPPELREHHSRIRRGKKHSPKWRAAISAGLKGKPKSPEHIAAAAEGQRGTKKARGWWSTEEGRAKQKANNRGHSGHFHSQKTKRKIRSARAKQTNFGGRFESGYQPSDEVRAKLRIAAHAHWVLRKAEITRNSVMVSSTWANQNSVRYPVAK